MDSSHGLWPYLEYPNPNMLLFGPVRPVGEDACSRVSGSRLREDAWRRLRRRIYNCV